MSSYLARLKVIEGGKVFANCPQPLPPKPPKAPFAGFAGMGAKHIEKNVPTQTHWAWLLFYADREPMQAWFSPEATHDEVLDWFLDAEAAQPFNPTSTSTAIPERSNNDMALHEPIEKQSGGDMET